MSSEFERIERIRAKLGLPDERVELGIGDDCAVVRIPEAQTLTSTDIAVENVHFRREWLTWSDVGYRAFVGATSDLYAMGAAARFALLSVVTPRDFSDDELDELCTGIADACSRSGSHVVGGNLSRGSEFSLGTTVFAGADTWITRGGAKVGDGIYVTGTVGDAALGLETLSRNAPHEKNDPFVARWRRPPIRKEEADVIRRIGNACIDVSDGLLQDLMHLLSASHVGANLMAAGIPRHPYFADRSRELGLESSVFGLHGDGGEDYELLFTSPHQSDAEQVATRIGTVTEQGLSVRGADGTELLFDAQGFEHFYE